MTNKNLQRRNTGVPSAALRTGSSTALLANCASSFAQDDDEKHATAKQKAKREADSSPFGFAQGTE
jgi:hypothetical protein